MQKQNKQEQTKEPETVGEDWEIEFGVKWTRWIIDYLCSGAKDKDLPTIEDKEQIKSEIKSFIRSLLTSKLDEQREEMENRNKKIIEELKEWKISYPKKFGTEAMVGYFQGIDDAVMLINQALKDVHEALKGEK